MSVTIDGNLRILVLEDDPAHARLIGRMLGAFVPNGSVLHMDSLGQAELLGGAFDLSCIILDLNLKDSHGIETLTKMNDAMPDVPIIVFSSDRSVGEHEATRAGAAAMLRKGEADGRDLARIIREVAS